MIQELKAETAVESKMGAAIVDFIGGDRYQQLHQLSLVGYPSEPEKEVKAKASERLYWVEDCLKAINVLKRLPENAQALLTIHISAAQMRALAEDASFPKAHDYKKAAALMAPLLEQLPSYAEAKAATSPHR